MTNPTSTQRTVIDFRNQTGIEQEVFPHILQVGTGGTGTYVTQQIAQLLSLMPHVGKYILADPDIVETKNLNNQLFLPKDVGLKKADVLARRYRSAYKLQISSYSSEYVESVETLETLFHKEYLEGASGRFYLPILISNVDNNYSRAIFHQFFEEHEGNLLYIDVGNEAVAIPEGNPIKETWSEEEKQTYDRSGYTGQLVCGLKIGRKVICEPIASVYPDILEDNDEIAPSQLSCSALLASEPQRLITNRYAAMCVGTVLNEVLLTGKLSTHKMVFHALRGHMRSEGIYL